MTPLKAATAAAAELVEQAHDCANLAADQHKIAEKQLVASMESVQKQHENADKLEELGETLINQAIKKTGVAEIKALEVEARTRCR